MTKKKYNIPDRLLKQYSDENEYIDFNEEDRDLDTIRVYLPKTPDWDKIDYFGLEPSEQYYRRPEVPPRLIALQEEKDDNSDYLSNDEIWERINAEAQNYEAEIEWIRLQWERRLYGYWFFNNGKATYMDGWGYFFCGFWPIPTQSGFPDYRDRDRRWFIFARFCYNDPTLFGFISPKHRREGSTSKASCVNYCIATTALRGKTGIQSLNEASAKDVFQDHLVPAWQNMLFIFKPNTAGSDNPKRELLFTPPAIKGKLGIKKRSRKSLGTRMDYRSSGAKAYDGNKLIFIHLDEVGKTVEVNINERWDTVRLCLSLGGGSTIIGFTILTSTVGEMESGGGENMKELCDASKYSQRSDSGQTASGLCILFIPCFDGLHGFIDKYGMSVMDTPTPEQAKFIGKTVGAKEYIEKEIEHKKKNSTQDRVMDFMREHPTSFRGCFRTAGKDSFFNVPKIEERLDELDDMRTATVRVNFEWDGRKWGGKVRCVIDPENGLFEVSKTLIGAQANRVAYDSAAQSWYPLNLGMCAGGDTFKANETKSKKNSKGAGAVFWGHDINIDPHEKDISQWESNRFVCTYLNRPADKEDYIEHMIMMCIWWGCGIYIETNVQDLKDGFIKYGYKDMLVWRWDLSKEKFDPIAGQATSTSTKQEIFKLWQVYINRHCSRERHAILLKQVRDISNPDAMTFYDLFTAGGYSMLGIDQYYQSYQSTYNNQQEQSSFSQPLFPTFPYRNN